MGEIIEEEEDGYEEEDDEDEEEDDEVGEQEENLNKNSLTKLLITEVFVIFRL